MFSQSIFARWFTKTTPVGVIILGIGLIGISLYGIVTGQCLVVQDLYGTKGRIVSALGLAVGVAVLIYGIKTL